MAKVAGSEKSRIIGGDMFDIHFGVHGGDCVGGRKGGLLVIECRERELFLQVITAFEVVGW